MNSDSKEIPGEIAYKLSRNLTTGIEGMKMTESVVDDKILASKTFMHADSILKGEITATLDSDWKIRVRRSDDYKINYKFSLLVSEEDQLLFFNELATPGAYERFKFSRNHSLELEHVEFAHSLMEQKLPKSLAVRLAVIGSSVENPEAMWEAYRNLKQAFFYNRRTGQSSFEIYMLMANQFGIPFADSVFRLRGYSLEMLEDTHLKTKEMRLHEDAKGLISMSTPESLETFLVIGRFMNMSSKQNALVTSRLVSDEGNIDWNLVTALNDRMTRGVELEDLVDSSDLEFVQHFQFAESRQRLLSGVYDLPSRDYLVTVFAVLMAKYGLKPILQAVNKIREDRLTNNTFAAFIVVTDFIGQTGDTDTNLQWILLLSGDMDEDNFS
jgi:hypothetical protein